MLQLQRMTLKVKSTVTLKVKRSQGGGVTLHSPSYRERKRLHLVIPRPRHGSGLLKLTESGTPLCPFMTQSINGGGGKVM